MGDETTLESQNRQCLGDSSGGGPPINSSLSNILESTGISTHSRFADPTNDRSRTGSFTLKIVFKMAASTNTWCECVARWSSVCELGMDAALREAGCSEQNIARIVRSVEGDDEVNLSELDRIIDTEPGRAAILATLGRGNTRVRTIFANGVTMSENEAAALCVNLGSNAKIDYLNVEEVKVFGTVKGCTLLGHALAINSSLTRLQLDHVYMESDGVRCLLDGLQSNKDLKKFSLRRNPLLDEGVRFVAEFLRNNPALEELYLYRTGSGAEGATHISSALGLNTALKVLSYEVQGVGRKGVERLLQPFSQGVNSKERPKNTTLEKLYLHEVDGEHVDSIAHVIRTNKSLCSLELDRVYIKETLAPILPSHWKHKIFPALKENDTLKELHLCRCEGLVGEEVFESLMDVLQNSSTRLESINLRITGLETRQGQVDEELRINKEYRTRLRGQAQTGTTSGRIVLCGYGFGGKTEISKTMQRIENGTPFAHSFKMGWKKLMQTYPSLQRILCGRDAYKEFTTRTRGFEIVVLHNHAPLKAIWDFAGQKEYYALHDYVFPTIKNSYFLYVCSCRCTPDPLHLKGRVKDHDMIKEECEYWMRFLASNSKPGWVGGRRQLPRVRFVLTKTDTLDSLQETISIVSKAEHVVRELEGLFKHVLDLCEVVEVVTAHSSVDVQRLLGESVDNLEKILADQNEYLVCEEVRKLLEGWSARNPNKPVLGLRAFFSLLEEQHQFDQFSEDGWKIVLASLNDLGEIIFPKESTFIVTNPSWFGLDLLGSLIDAFKATDQNQADVVNCCIEDVFNCCIAACCRQMPFYSLYHEHGFVKRRGVVKHLERSLKSMDLESIPAEELIDLMFRLELCFKNEPELEESESDPLIFMPALFDDKTESAAKGERQLTWKLLQAGKFEFLGRRLECQDKSTTFLTPGFFPRLQVHLWNYINEKGLIKNLGFEVGRNLICFAENGVEVCVEYAGDNDDYIDILVRSSKPYAKALEFVEDHVVKIIRTFCASPQGCQGVVLVESVIRLVCVEHLHLCVHRKAHSILVSKLEDELRKDNDYCYTWSKSLPNVRDVDWALDLLQGAGSYERKQKNWRKQNNQLKISDSMPSQSISTDELPKLLYPSIEDVGILRKLETRLNFANVIPIKLHLLCEYQDASYILEGHIVEGQLGRTVKLNATAKGYGVPIAKLALTLLWVAMDAGAARVGASFALPQTDFWIDSLFDVPELPAIDGETLRPITGKPLGPVSKEEIVKALKRYWETNPSTQAVKDILKLDEMQNFRKDFQLRKVTYTEGDHKGKVCWLCDEHFQQGWQQRILVMKID